MENTTQVGPKGAAEQCTFSGPVAKRREEHAFGEDEKTWDHMAEEMKDWKQRRKIGNSLSIGDRKHTPLLKHMMQRVIKCIGFRKDKGSW